MDHLQVLTEKKLKKEANKLKTSKNEIEETQKFAWREGLVIGRPVS